MRLTDEDRKALSSCLWCGDRPQFYPTAHIAKDGGRWSTRYLLCRCEARTISMEAEDAWAEWQAGRYMVPVGIAAPPNAIMIVREFDDVVMRHDSPGRIILAVPDTHWRRFYEHLAFVSPFALDYLNGFDPIPDKCFGSASFRLELQDSDCMVRLSGMRRNLQGGMDFTFETLSTIFIARGRCSLKEWTDMKVPVPPLVEKMMLSLAEKID